MVLVPILSTSAYSVYPTTPPSSHFLFNPSANPAPVSPPVSDRTFARPFNINPDLYNDMLHVSWPISIALVYAITVSFFNRVNKRRQHKPWAFSKTLAFYILVVAHNVFLAVYSGWTFAGMLNTIRQSWPGWNAEYGLAGAADALCKMHGPRGLGSAATYNETTGSWGFTDMAMNLVGGNPDTTDLGRMWNEGLAFYGWLFYLSKFYEVVDTAIILAKGKKSSLLQTYHHAGAMLCMWAGIRYMSPPIWMFTFINSGLHTLMYTYYTLAALTIRVPSALKRTLTTLQIAQILFGGSYALAHLFLDYDIPLNSPYLFVHNLSTALPSAGASIPSAAASLATSAASAGLGNWIKKAALRAAGEEGLAENVRNYQGETFGIDAIHAAEVEKAQEEIRYKLAPHRVHCLDTSGQVFAIMINAIYLAPLAYLFITFFYRSYIAGTRTDKAQKATVRENILKSADEAVEALEKRIEQAMRDTQGGTTEPPKNLKAELEDTKTSVKNAANDLGDKTKQKSKDTSEKMKKDLMDLREKGKKSADDATKWTQDAAGDLPAKAQQSIQDAAADAKAAVQNASDIVKDKAQSVKEQVSKQGGKKSEGAAWWTQGSKKPAVQNAEETTDQIAEKAENVTDEAAEKAEETKDAVGDEANESKKIESESDEEGEAEIKSEEGKKEEENQDETANDDEHETGDNAAAEVEPEDEKPDGSEGKGEEGEDDNGLGGSEYEKDMALSGYEQEDKKEENEEEQYRNYEKYMEA